MSAARAQVDAPTKVLLVEDHDLIAQGVAIALRAEGFDAVVADDLSPEAVLRRVEDDQPAVVLLDLHLDDVGGTGLPLIAPLTARGARVVVLTGVTDRIELAACVEAGAYGLGSKAQSFATILDKVIRAAAGEPVLTVGERATLLEELRLHRQAQRQLLAPFERLSARESETLLALMDGLQAESIADANFVSLATVRSHIRSILTKVGVSSQLAAVATARRAGWSGAAVHHN